jgi:hypothetical protein
MSLLNMLSLSDEDIDLVTSVIHGWCRENRISLDSQRGQEAMSAAVQLCIAGEKSPDMLADKLSHQMKLNDPKAAE